MKKTLLILMVILPLLASSQGSRKLFGLGINNTPPSTRRLAIGEAGSLAENITLGEFYNLVSAQLNVYTVTEVDDLFNNYISKTNTTSYTPTSDYHPATKKYVDDNVAGSTTPWTDLIPNTSVINYYPKAKVSERNGLVTITGIFAFIPDGNAINQENLVFTIPSSIPLCTQDIEIVCGQIIPGDEEVLVLYIPANTRNIRLRLRGDYPQEYYFTVTYPAI